MNLQTAIANSVCRRSRQGLMLLPGEKVLCPMTTIAGARAELPGHDEDDVLALIEEGAGKLSWAWDISLLHAQLLRQREDTNAAREIRILTACLRHYAKTGRPLNWDFEDALTEILHGYNKPFFTGTRIQLVLNCGSTHVMNLIQAKALKVLPGTTWHTGPQGSPVITRESFVEFLKVRRVV